jgi:hypothetical protein
MIAPERDDHLMSIADHIEQIRAFINHSRRPPSLLPNVADWNTLCSALDVICDTEWGLDAYANWKIEVDVGQRYLLVYGVLQELLTQQDSVKKVCNAFQHPLSFPPALQTIRKIRSDSIGHPTFSKENKIAKANFIQHISLSHSGFTLLTVSSDSKYRTTQVNILELMQEQRNALDSMLLGLVEKLRSNEMMHREKYRDEKLYDILTGGLGYALGKIYEGVSGDTEFLLVGIHLREIKGCLGRFRAALEARGDLGGTVLHDLGLLDYPLEKLDEYAANRNGTRLNDKDAYIFARFVESQIDELKMIAKDLDDEYAAEPAESVEPSPYNVETLGEDE